MNSEFIIISSIITACFCFCFSSCLCISKNCNNMFSLSQNKNNIVITKQPEIQQFTPINVIQQHQYPINHQQYPTQHHQQYPTQHQQQQSVMV